MAIEVFNRYEKKFLLDTGTYSQVLDILEQHMELDRYNREQPYYTISNIYYDTEDDELIRKSIEKPQYKEKLRLRAYGVPSGDDLVFLEIKKKVKGLVNKRRTAITLEEAQQFVGSGKLPVRKEYMNWQVMQEIAYLLNQHRLIPRLYLAYDRRAYFGIGHSDLRISFDTNIRTRREDLDLALGDCGKRLLGADTWLMEVKAEKTVPVWLSHMLSELHIFSTNFSKYGTEYKVYLNKKQNGEEITCLTSYGVQVLTASLPLQAR